MFHLSQSETTLLLVLAVVEAGVGYFLSEADRRNLGRTPWGVPSLVWALIWFLSLLLGVVLYFVAHRAEVRRVDQTGPRGPGAPVQPPTQAQAQASGRSGSDFPAYPRPAGGGSDHRSASELATPSPAGPASPPSPPTPAQLSGAAPASWQADPSGRFHYRWWTGAEWTSFVSTHGQVVVDTDPDQRTGPY